MKQKILFIVDSPDWAFHNIAKEIQNRFSKQYDFYVDFADLFKLQQVPKISYWKFALKNTKALLLFFLGQFIKRYRRPIPIHLHGRKLVKLYVPSFWKVVYFRSQPLERSILPYRISYDLVIYMSYYFQFTSCLPHNGKKKMVGIYTESYPHSGNNYDLKKGKNITGLSRIEFIKEYLQQYDGLFVGSKMLYEIYGKHLPNVYLVNAIYKESDFRVWTNKDKFISEKLVLGWTGNPGREFKGFHTVIEPAVKKVRDSGKLVELKTQFSGTYESLIEFYDHVACILIASSADTGPSMFSEASLSGIPAISTRVGFPLMVIENGKNGLFVEREIDAMANAIEYLYDNRQQLLSMAENIRQDYLKSIGNDILTADFHKAVSQKSAPTH